MTVLYNLITKCDFCSDVHEFHFKVMENHSFNYKIGDRTMQNCRSCGRLNAKRIIRIWESIVNKMEKFARSFNVRIVCDNCMLIDDFTFEILTNHFQLDFKKGDFVNGKCRNCKYHQCSRVLDTMYLGLNIIEADN